MPISNDIVAPAKPPGLLRRPRLPLQTLPTFLAVAEGENLRATAKRMHLTHSAISQQIRLMEEHLGFALFERRARKLVLNAAGEALKAAVAPALAQLNAGVESAAAIAAGTEQRIRISVLPSFARQWLLPRIARWHLAHPGISLEIDSSLTLVDLQRDGFHAALRGGKGPWRGVAATCLIDSPELVLVCSPELYVHLQNCTPAELATEALIGDAGRWERWFAMAGCKVHVRPVASFNDMGLMVQAAEQSLGIALVRELLAADALRDGRLRRLSRITLRETSLNSYWLVSQPELTDWPPMVALLAWLQAQLHQSREELLQQHSF